MLAVVSLILVCFVGACKCRGHWAQFSCRVKLLLVLAASLVVAAYAFLLITGWHFASTLANEIVGSVAVGGYCFLVLLVTLFRPKPLAYCLGALLLLVFPVALVWLPLLARDPGPAKTEHIEGTLFVRHCRWDAGAFGSSGASLVIYRKSGSFLSWNAACKELFLTIPSV